CERWTAVVLQRAEHRSRVDLVAGSRQKTAAVIAAQVVAERDDYAEAIRNVRATTSIQDGVSDRQRRAAGKAVVEDAAAVDGSRVAADGAITDRQRGVIVEDAAADAKVGDAISNSQSGNGDIGARADLKYAKGRRAASGAALKRRSIAVDDQRMAGVA